MIARPNHSMRRGTWIVSLVCLVAALATPVLAQPAAKPAPAAEPAAKAEQRQERVRKLRDKVLRQRAGLDANKAAHVEKVLRDYQDNQRAIRASIRDSRQRLRKLLKDDSQDQAAYKAALEQFRKAHADLARLREKEFAALDEKLTPREQAKLLATLVQVRRALNHQRAAKRIQKRKRRPRRKR
jgi:Spy/CpxP family protein refolding chaperone